MASIEVQVTATSAAPVEATFDQIVPIDLTTIFTGFGPLPAVVGVSDMTGAWDAAGQSRTVHLDDGSTARERLERVTRPHYFSYRLGDFDGALRHIAAGAHGQWWFTPHGDTTDIRWSYAFESRSAATVPAVLAISRVWKRYMQRALDAAVTSVRWQD